MDKKAMKKAKAIVVGGSISGLSCAHALVSSGWEVVVVEKTPSPPTGSPTGAGLGLDPLVQSILSQWLMQPHLLQNTTMPLSIDQFACMERGARLLSGDEHTEATRGTEGISIFREVPLLKLELTGLTIVLYELLNKGLSGFGFCQSTLSGT
ncbi:hypothetical protein Leryth_000644 [Lithospermum erythrorhizon]|nr:hypothetical protein Leryth_000644 [Lithospermum erythrorhizon]